MGSKTQTATSQQTSTPVNQAALQSIYGQVSNAAQTPYVPYSGELTAGFNGQQQSGVNTINSAANSAQPYYSQAAGLATGAANPLTAAQIAQYQNPYTQSVVNATQAQFNDQNGQQQNSLKGTAAQQGALGGDRQAVAQAQLAGQQQLSQAPVIAGLYSNSYNSGLQTAAQQFQQNPLAASSAISGIGTNVENAGLAGGAAQLAAGTQQQQTSQAADTANYNQYLAQQANPYQNAAFLEQYGLPSALGQGSNFSGTQTTQGPSSVAPYLGAAVSAAGLFAKDGGRIEGFASGGSPGYVNSPLGYVDSHQGYIPTGQASQNTLQAPSLKFLSPSSTSSSAIPMTGTGSIGSLGTSLQNDYGTASFGGGNALSGDAWGGDKNNPIEGLSASDYSYKIGGLVEAIHHIHKTIKRARGGTVGSAPFQAFDDGGDVSFADRFAPASDNPFGDMSRGQAIKFLANQNDATLAPQSIPGGEAPPAAPDAVVNPDTPFRMDPSADQSWRAGVDQPNPALVADSKMPNADGTAPNPMTRGLPPQITNPDNTPDEQSSALGYDSRNPMKGPMGANGQPTIITPTTTPPDSDQHVGHSLFGANLSDKTRQSLIAAGLGIMASRSPFLGVALGEGGLQGLKSYSESSKAEQEAAEKAATRAQEQQRIEMQGKQLALSVENQKRTIASAPLIQGPDGKMIPNEAELAYEKRKADINSKDNWQPIGNVVSGDTVHPLVQNRTDGSVKDAVTGLPPKDGDKIEPKGQKVALSADDAKDIARYYVATGDKSRMQGLGMNGDNKALVSHAITEVKKDLNVSDQELAQRTAEFEGSKAGQRTLAVQESKMGSAAFEAEGAIKQARGIIEKLPRTSFLPWNELVEGYSKKTLNPDQVELAGRTQAIINTYAAVMARGANITTDSARGHAEALLNTAGNPATYNRMLDTMLSEITMAKNSPERMRQFYREKMGANSVAPDNSAGASSSGAPAAPAPPSGVPSGSAYSPSRKKWRDPSGQIYNADGSKV